MATFPPVTSVPALTSELYQPSVAAGLATPFVVGHTPQLIHGSFFTMAAHSEVVANMDRKHAHSAPIALLKTDTDIKVGSPNRAFLSVWNYVNCLSDEDLPLWPEMTLREQFKVWNYASALGVPLKAAFLELWASLLLNTFELEADDKKEETKAEALAILHRAPSSVEDRFIVARTFRVALIYLIPHHPVLQGALLQLAQSLPFEYRRVIYFGPTPTKYLDTDDFHSGTIVSVMDAMTGETLTTLQIATIERESEERYSDQGSYYHHFYIATMTDDSIFTEDAPAEWTSPAFPDRHLALRPLTAEDAAPQQEWKVGMMIDVYDDDDQLLESHPIEKIIVVPVSELLEKGTNIPYIERKKYKASINPRLTQYTKTTRVVTIDGKDFYEDDTHSYWFVPSIHDERFHLTPHVA